MGNIKVPKIQIRCTFQPFVELLGDTFFRIAFDILALLKGTYQPHVLSSLYCMGTTYQENGSCVETRYFDPEAVKRYREETAAILKAQGYEGLQKE